MQLALGISISREFWRQIYPADRTPSIGARTNPDSENLAINAADVRSLIPSWAATNSLGLPSDQAATFAPSTLTRRRSQEHRACGSFKHMPPHSFFSYSDSVFIASPELLFLESARHLPLEQLIAFGDELCGTYSFNRNSERGFRQREFPLTSRARLDSYLGSATGARGVRLARKALPYIVDGSASPMETFTEMALGLPFNYEGYCFGSPRMNHVLELPSNLRAVASRNYCVADMYWPDQHLDVEYLGDFDHASRNALRSDRRRTNALAAAGINVVELTYDEVSNVLIFDEIAQHIAEILGKRLRAENRGAIPQRLRLRRLLFAWNQGDWMW